MKLTIRELAIIKDILDEALSVPVLDKNIVGAAELEELIEKVDNIISHNIELISRPKK